MTHSELVTRAAKWMRSTLRCSVVIEEMVAYTFNGETPDAIGWRGGYSVLVECKISRADFRRDLHKSFRCGAINGMGDWRFYVTPRGLLRAKDCLDGWGIYEVIGKRIVHAHGERFGNAKPPPFAGCMRSERAILLSALRRSQANAERPKNER